MCGTCGCGEDDHITYRKIEHPDDAHMHYHTHVHKHGDLEHSHPHHHTHSHHDGHVLHDHAHDHAHHDHPHEHDHPHAHPNPLTIRIERNILDKNLQYAERNRGYFEALKVTAFNLVSSPGSGKTTLLERTISALKAQKQLYVIEGDQQTSNDARRISQAGAPVIQINTGNGCHLDAIMVNKAVKQLDLKPESLLFIENVGNLVCPALFDLGETKRVVIISVTEGDDKPAKYPNMFETSGLCIVNKIDLLPYVDFDIESFESTLRKINRNIGIIRLSARTGEGFDQWLEWIGREAGK
ncbi:MAG: hydrogenase nickel incorporation protein HypB [Bacteroidetes bacterium]|nr:hydrogenase nickel incorporation protein HypB [Bacteroidota bacterium]